MLIRGSIVFSVQRPLKVALLASLSFFAVSAFGGTVLSENFDELTPGASQTSIGAFTAINGTNVDVVGDVNGNYVASLCAAPESGNCIDMDGTGGLTEGELQSNAAFDPGTYLLSFDLIGSQRGVTASVTVTFGDYDQTFTLASGDDTDGIVVDAPVTVSGSPLNLLFVSDTSGQEGLLLDDVVITSTASAAPEPSSVFLLVSGLVGVAIATRRRRRTA